IGSFVIGIVTGEDGMREIEPFIGAPFKGVLCLFLLDMGLIAGRNIRNSRGVLTPGLFAFGLIMPVIGAAFGLLAGMIIGLSPGGLFLLAVLAASASYIAVPAAMRVAVPEADPGIYLTLSLAITFPFNLTLGLPLYMVGASIISGGIP
ncbi:MAG: sodium-dependent bicarbonate transport family permease, partial [Pseudomonadota bacterium]